MLPGRQPRDSDRHDPAADPSVEWRRRGLPEQPPEADARTSVAELRWRGDGLCGVGSAKRAPRARTVEGGTSRACDWRTVYQLPAGWRRAS
jgi:hypothetical protein